MPEAHHCKSNPNKGSHAANRRYPSRSLRLIITRTARPCVFCFLDRIKNYPLRENVQPGKYSPQCNPSQPPEAQVLPRLVVVQIFQLDRCDPVILVKVNSDDAVGNPKRKQENTSQRPGQNHTAEHPMVKSRPSALQRKSIRSFHIEFWSGMLGARRVSFGTPGTGFIPGTVERRRRVDTKQGGRCQIHDGAIPAHVARSIGIQEVRVRGFSRRGRSGRLW